MVKIISTQEWNEATERAINDPNYTVADDPRCLWGWGPPGKKGCDHRFGHACGREFGHVGMCMDFPVEDKCQVDRRPKDWDSSGREEANK
jgi:hypothetical protein